MRKLWDSLYFVSDQGQAIHPFIYTHPITKEPCLCIHTGEAFIQCFVTGFNPRTMEADSVMDWKNTQAMLTIIAEKLDNKQLVYRRDWEQYDFAIIDNLAVAHKAVPETQAAVSEAGLRVLHRTTIKGEHKPKK